MQVFFAKELLAQTEVVRLMRIDLEARRYSQLPKEKVKIEPKKEMKDRHTNNVMGCSAAEFNEGQLD